jgi:hypothetical protein
MTYKSNYDIQGSFKFFDNEEHLRREWKQHARANIRLKTFLEGILLRSLDPGSKCVLMICFFFSFYQTKCLLREKYFSFST